MSLTRLNRIVKEQEGTHIIPSAQIKAGFSVPVVLLAGVSGHLWLPKYVYMEKSAGTPYVANGNANLELALQGVITLRNYAIATFLAQAGVTWEIDRHGTTFGVTNANGLGQNIVVKLPTADMVTGSGDVRFDYVFELLRVF